MWAFVWLLQGLVVSAAGVYLNTHCIRSLLRCGPFQLSLSDGKYSNTFIEDSTTLNRQCRGISPLLECMQEAVLLKCNLNISPAEKEFVKTRLFIAEICKDIDYTQKVYLRNAACINRERDWIIQACNPQDYVQLVNTSNLISLEGSCLFQKLLINCRQDAIHDKCGPDAADLYQRVKAVDVNLDFLCLESRDLRSPEFMLDVVINSYISLLLETLRPVLFMESFYLKDVAKVSQEETTATPTNVKVFPPKRAKMSAHYVQDVAEYKWRRSGDIPLETVTESLSEDESSIDSVDEEYFTVPSTLTFLEPVAMNTVKVGPRLGSCSVRTQSPVHQTVSVEAGAGSDRLAPVEEHVPDGLIDRTGLDWDGLLNTESSDVEEEASSDSAEHPDRAGTGFEQARLGSESSSTEVILGVPILQFGYAEVDATKDTNDVSDDSDTVTIQGNTMREPSDLETATDFDEFHGMATKCPEYLETTVADDTDGAEETTTQYHGGHETSPDLGTVEISTLHSGDQEASPANSDDVQETTTQYPDSLETTTDDLEPLQETTTSLYSRDYLEDTAAESYAPIEETGAKLDGNEEHIFDTSLPPETTRADFVKKSGSSSPHSIIPHLKRVEEFVSNPEQDSEKIKEFLEDLAKISASEELASQEYVRNKMFKDVAWVVYSFIKKANPEVEVMLKNLSDAINFPLALERMQVLWNTSNAKGIDSATTENVESVENLKRRERIGGNFEEELDGYVESTVVSGVIDVLGTMFAPKEIERRSVSLPPHFINSMSPVEVEQLIQKSLPGGEFVKELVKSLDQTVNAESERLKTSAGHKDVKTPEDPVSDLKTIKSIAELGVKLNYVLIGESYVPLEVGYVEGNEERKSNRNLKIPRRKFKFYTSTPTEPSSEIPEDLEFSTTEYLPETTSTDEPESFSKSDSTETLSSDFSCPEVTGNLTPRISHLVDPAKRSRMEECFGDLGEETRLADDQSPEDERSGENPGETEQELRRSGDILPGEVDPRNLDLENMVALKFYGEVLTELVTMLQPESPDSKTLAKRASAMVDVLGNYVKANVKKYPSETVRTEKLRSKKNSGRKSAGRRFQKRSLSLSAECADQVKPVDGECKKSKTDDGVRFDIGYSPESYIRLEMSYPSANRKEDAFDVPVAKYIRMGETRLPLEIHFTHKNVNYVHYAQINIPRRSVDLKDTIALDEV